MKFISCRAAVYQHLLVPVHMQYAHDDFFSQTGCMKPLVPYIHSTPSPFALITKCEYSDCALAKDCSCLMHVPHVVNRNCF